MKNFKFIALIAISILVLLSVFSCSEKQEEVNTLADLRGEWIQEDYTSSETYMTAVVTDTTIEVYWNMDGGNTTSLYWAGSFTAPTESGSYSWDSANDHEKTDASILASGDDTKTFSYDEGKISFSMSAMGVTKTVYLIQNAE